MTNRILRSLATAFGWAGLSFVTAGSLSAQTYQLTDLGVLVGPQSYAQGINNSGSVVGYWHTPANGTRAFLFSDGAVTDLGSLGDIHRHALSINNPGDVVGFAETANGVEAFLRRDGATTALGALGGREQLRVRH